MKKRYRLMKYAEIAKEIRRDVVRMHFNANASHVASSLSCVDLLVALYAAILRINRKKYHSKNRDRFILSKGHAASAIYATLSKMHFFDKRILVQYCRDGGTLPGHVTIRCVPGIEASAGSLGHGLAIGAGMAIAAKHDRLPYRVFVLMSDGECDEGSVWESALFASHHKLDNLVAIIDYNKIQAFGRTDEVLNLEPFVEKWKSFGFSVKEVNGHDIKRIISTFKKIPFKKNKPSVVLAHTIKGKGVSFMENKLLWHYKSPDKKELEFALQELT